MTDRVLILDFGSQVTQLIARRIREAGVYCEIMPFNTDPQKIAEFAPKAIIFSGGPASVTEMGTPRAPEIAFEMGVPLLGICYGHQTLCAQLGGEVERSDHREFGRAFVEVVEDCALLDGVWGKGDRQQVWMSHGDRVTKLPPGFRAVGVSEGAPLAIVADDARRYYGLMFHPEVVHTPEGGRLLESFVRRIAGSGGDWTMAAFREQEIAKIRRQVGKGRVICGLSGGVDSAVAAVLIHEAIGEQLHCIFVDHGLLRAGEGEDVVRLFRDHYNIPLVHRDASDLFLGKLAGITDPEQKRKIIGGLFIDVFEEEAKRLGGADFLAQGTLYPDVIESVSFSGGPSVTIKIPPQCRRPAGPHAPQAGRAPARAVQGRGAGAGPRARPARRRWSSAIPSRARASPSASPARSRARSSPCCARPMPSISRRSSAPASTTPSGRPSPCCCR